MSYISVLKFTCTTIIESKVDLISSYMFRVKVRTNTILRKLYNGKSVCTLKALTFLSKDYSCQREEEQVLRTLLINYAQVCV